MATRMYKTVQVRLSKDEYKIVRELAKGAKVTISAVVRYAILGGKLQP